MQIQHDSLLRLPEVLALIPVSRATWYAGVKNGRFPQPVALGPRCVAWRASEIQRLVSHGA
ncbi:helix-turn-helix transcriptional regulator [Paraburkholderia sp. EG285A]|uniref:helix-turn-helix transcriptional regulator n=1 Tax=Paraburkholderia sp. EG285A TaxID=3237009 RepID=UPI0034D30455